MKSLYIGKTIYNEKSTLIITDGLKFSPISEVGTLDDLLNLSHRDICLLATKPLLYNFKKFSEDFLENQQVWGTGITFPWTEEKLNTYPDNNPYKKAYFCERPMFFHKGTKENHAKMYDAIGMRRDSPRNIPEAEIVAVFNQFGEIIGFTIGNDQTAISLEHENPLFQFQAKYFSKSHSFLPMINITTSLDGITINLKIFRDNNVIFDNGYSLEYFKKSLTSIGDYLFKGNNHNNGIFLFLGFNLNYLTDFNLQLNDEVIISSPQFPITLSQKCIWV